MSRKREKFASVGIATKGIVYFLIGTLTALAAFDYGGEKSDSDTVIEFIARQPFGQVLLILLAIGLLGYVFWRWYQAFTNPQDIENNRKGTLKRIAYFISGLFYGFLAYSAVKTVVGSISSGDSAYVAVFKSEYGFIIAIIIGLSLLGKGVYEFYQAYSGKFKDEVESSSIPNQAKDVLFKAGKVGYSARGIVVGILGFLFLKAGLSGGTNKLSKTDAFGFIENEFGSVVLGLIALGLVSYGIFMMIKSKYSSLSVD